MLYARLLDTCGQLYGDSDLTGKAAKLRATILDMSMTESGFFCDNALRQDGKLVLSGERTESCQYYAFFCDIVTPESHPWLWETLLHDFGYDRATRGLYPEIYPANAFIGNYLRLDLLDRYGCREALYDNIKATLPTWRTRPARCGRTWVTTPPATTGSPRTCCTGWIILDC